MTRFSGFFFFFSTLTNGILKTSVIDIEMCAHEEQLNTAHCITACDKAEHPHLCGSQLIHVSTLRAEILDSTTNCILASCIQLFHVCHTYEELV